MVIPVECKQVGNVSAAKFVKMLDSVNLASLVDTWTLIGLVLCIFCVGCTGLLCAWFEETTIRVKPRLSPARKVGTMRVKQRRFGGLLRATYVANQNMRLHTALMLSSCSLWGLCNASWFHAACCLVSKCKSLLTVRRRVPSTRRVPCPQACSQTTAPACDYVQKHWLLRGGTALPGNGKQNKKDQRLLAALL